MNSVNNCSNACKVGVGRGTSLVKKSIFISIPFVVLMAACGSSAYEKAAYEEKAKEVADSVSSYVAGIATDTIAGVTHNFIRKADVKCKVKDVLQTTRQVEQLANSVGGYVTKSELNSNKEYSTTTQHKKDSIMEQTHYAATSNITLRIPNKQMDSVIGRITDMAVFVDYRTITSDDVKLKLFANKLAENRYSNYKARVQNTIDKKDAKLNQVTNAEENALEKQTLADNKRIESYDLADQVNYSTIVLTLYQPQNTLYNVLPKPNSIEVYTPPFTTKLGIAFANGFELLKNFILFIANCWSLILILFVAYLTIKKVVVYYSKKAA